MQIELFNHIVSADYGQDRLDDTVVTQIIDHTKNTWQPGRSKDEKGQDTKQGKIAEEIVEQFLTQFLSDCICLKSYDDIRNDGYEKHAPFDFLIWEKGTADISRIEASIRNDISNTTNKFVKLSQYTRKLCEASNVKTVEVKSTKIRDDIKRAAKFNENYDDHKEVLKLIHEIKRKDDIFCYPHFKRSDLSENYSISDYCNFVKHREYSLSKYTGETLRKKVIDLEVLHQCCDVFIRVYIDPLAPRGFVIGWLQKERLLDYDVCFKKMKQKNKSEQALYFAKNLSEVNGIDAIPEVFHKDTIVYASPFTKTNFYHRKRDCKYIQNVSENDLIIFDTEADAITDGRFTSRCRNCFDHQKG